jgi:hypothetical protein
VSPSHKPSLGVLHVPRVADQPLAQVLARLLDEGRAPARYEQCARAGQPGRVRQVTSVADQDHNHNQMRCLVADAPNLVLSWKATRPASWVKAEVLVDHAPSKRGEDVRGQDVVRVDREILLLNLLE